MPPAVDIISDLPRNVTECILERLPLRDAVRTSILSRKWRYSWRTLPQLVFGRQNFDYAVKNNYRFENIISKVLLLHNGPILKFSLHIPRFLESIPDISQWIYFLSTNGIKKLSLDNNQVKLLILPCCLFSIPELTFLSLVSCLFRPPPPFSGFRHLTTLCCYSVQFEAVTFEFLISSCPLLESFYFRSCSGFEHLDINCPTLRKLYIQDSGIKSICFQNTQNLRTVSIVLSYMLESSEEDATSNMIKFFHSLPNIECLFLESFFIKFLAAGSVPKRLPKSLNHLKSLELIEIDFTNIDEISCALCLIRSSPNLQKLGIQVKCSNDVMEPVSNFLEDHDLVDCMLVQLRKVDFRINGYFLETKQEFDTTELEFIEFLLAITPSLNTLTILHGHNIADAVLLGMTRELLRFRRASPKAEIIFTP